MSQRMKKERSRKTVSSKQKTLDTRNRKKKVKSQNVTNKLTRKTSEEQAEKIYNQAYQFGFVQGFEEGHEKMYLEAD